MIYDIIIAKRLAQYHRQAIGIKRSVSETDVVTLPSIAKTLSLMLQDTISSTDSIIPEEVMNVIKDLTMLANRPELGDEDLFTFREYLEILSFYSYEVYMINRVDLNENSEIDPNSTYAYMLDTVSDLLPDNHRICNGYGIKFEEVKDANIQNTFFNLASNVEFRSGLDDITGLNAAKETYEALFRAGAVDTMDVYEYIKVFENLGFKFIIIIPE